MNTKIWLKSSVCTLGVFSALGTAAENQKKESRPNVLIVLGDDIGYGDISLHGGVTPTPNIDRLAREGMELTNYMVYTVSSPSRAMLLTGRNPLRLESAPVVGGTIPPDEMTIGKAFQKAGYATGVFGKWHNSGDPDVPEFLEYYKEYARQKGLPRPTPFKVDPGGANAYGFDEAWVFYGGVDYFNHKTAYGAGYTNWFHNDEFRPQDTDQYMEEIIAREAMKFMAENSKKGKPFLCYWPTHIVHRPRQVVYPDYLAATRLPAHKGCRVLTEAEFDKYNLIRLSSGFPDDQLPVVYSAMLIAHNRLLGEVLDFLDKEKLRDNTILVWTSDNGAALPDGSNAPFRGGKHTLYEGGTHTPAFISWRDLPKGVKWEGLCGHADLFPTLAHMAGVPIPPETKPLDGKNIYEALKTGGKSPVESYYHLWSNEDAIRTEDYRMIRYYDRYELYDVKNDVAEEKNLAGQRPEVVKELAAKMDAWIEDIRLGVTHVPTRREIGEASPEGDVLEISVTQNQKTPDRKDYLKIVFATYPGHHSPTDVLVYDMMVPDGVLKRGYRVSPFQGGKDAPLFSYFNAVDQNGKKTWDGEMPEAGPGCWERRAVGLSNNAPNKMPHIALYLGGNQTGEYKIYFDNVHILHKDGSKTVLWESKKNIRNIETPVSSAFTAPSQRAVSLSSL